MADDADELFAGGARPRPAEGLVTYEVDDELLILDPRVDRLHQLDRLGTIIWSVLDGEATVDELVDDLADAFGAEPDLVRHDLGELLSGLDRLGLLDGSEPPAGADANTAPAPDRTDDDLWRPTYLVDPPAP